MTRADAKKISAPSEQAATTDTRRKRPIGIVILLIVSLVGMGWMQNIGESDRIKLVSQPGSMSSLTSLDSYSLVLLLGGLRGPLVMALWTNSEQLKQSTNLEDFDTQVQLIQLLQPEFDTVILFQMWNKAYNISAMMANLSNKYTSILDGIKYGWEIEKVRHDDLNIVYSVGDLFFSKLGTSSERDYYVDRVERESFPPIRITLPSVRRLDLAAAIGKSAIDDPNLRIEVDPQPTQFDGVATPTVSLLTDKISADRIRLFLGDKDVIYAPQEVHSPGPSEQMTRLPPLLDLQGRLLTYADGPNIPRPPAVEFAPLKEFGPFPYGLSPLGIGFSYYKRSQVLQDTTHQTHLQVAQGKIDDRPAVGLKVWAEVENDQANRLEIIAFGRPLPEGTPQRGEMGLVTAGTRYDARLFAPGVLPEAIYRYDFLERLTKVAEREYARHLEHYAFDTFLNDWHLSEMHARTAACHADADYLRAVYAHAMHAPVQEQQKYLNSAREDYEKAALLWKINILKFCPDASEASRVYPPPYNKATIQNMPPALIDQVFNRYAATFPPPSRDQNEMRTEYIRYLSRIYARLIILH